MIDFKVKIMLLDFETKAMLAMVTVMTVLSIIALVKSNIHYHYSEAGMSDSCRPLFLIELKKQPI